jgi:DNA-binding transcriptional LysR family regulator
VELRNLRAFVEVVRQGGFTEAAKVVFTTQSTVSKSVKQLEEELGIKVLDRIGTKSTLTAAGEIVFRRAVQMLGIRDDLVAELDSLQGLKRGVLRVGLPAVGSDILFAPIFASFRSRFPGIDIQLIERGSRELEEVLRSGQVEIAGLLQPVPEEFERVAVLNQPVVAACSRSHPLADRDRVDLRELSNDPFILFNSGFTMHDIVVNACDRAGFSPKVIAQSSQINFMLRLAAGGLGITFMPKLIVGLREHKDLALIALEDESMSWDMTLAWRRGAFLSGAATAWLALAAEKEVLAPSMAAVTQSASSEQRKQVKRAPKR